MADQSATLVTLTTDLLDVSAAAWDGSPNGRSVPTDRYVSHRAGGPVWEGCDALVVHLEAVRAEQGSMRSNQVQRSCHIVPVADLCVTLLRCGAPAPQEPSGDPPTPDTINLHAAELNTDGWILYAGLLTAWADDDLFPSFPGLGCADIQLQALTPLGPRGNIAGWRICLAVTLTATAT